MPVLLLAPNATNALGSGATRQRPRLTTRETARAVQQTY